MKQAGTVTFWDWTSSCLLLSCLVIRHCHQQKWRDLSMSSSHILQHRVWDRSPRFHLLHIRWEVRYMKWKGIRGMLMRHKTVNSAKEAPQNQTPDTAPTSVKCTNSHIPEIIRTDKSAESSFALVVNLGLNQQYECRGVK
jgi:hypothetical protein